MNRTGRYSTIISMVAILGLLFCLPAQAQEDFTLEASLSENQVFIGEQFSLQIEITGSSLRNIELPRIPQIDGIRVLNTNPSRGQSISIVNGRTTTVTSYTYTLIARDEGTFRIPPVPITIDGQEYTTNPLQGEVLQQGSLHAGNQERRPDIFARIEIHDDQPVVGQQLVANLVLYFRSGVEITSYQPAQGWRTDGFWKEDLENTEQPAAETVILGDVRYRKATLLRYALFPSRSGTLTLTPIELNVGIRTEPRRNDPFGSLFGGLGTNHRRVTIETEPMELSVRSIEPPATGVSIGAIGRFDIIRTASVTQAYVGESIELTTTISGEGNLPLIRRPEYSFPDNFEVYSPQESTELNRRGTTVSGTRIFRERFVPRTAGIFTIPEKQLAAYNPQTRSYTYTTLDPIPFEIIRDPAAAVSGSNTEADLRLMTGLAVWYSSDPNGVTLSVWWLWAGLVIPLLAAGAAWRRKRMVERLETDADFARSHYAWDCVEEHIIKAEELAAGTTPKQAYQQLHKAITGYIADRTGMPAAGMSNREICKGLSENLEAPELLESLETILNKCSDISYAPIDNQNDIHDDIRFTQHMLKQLRALL